MDFSCVNYGESTYRSKISSTIFEEGEKSITVSQVHSDGSRGEGVDIRHDRNDRHFYVDDFLEIPSSVMYDEKWQRGKLKCRKLPFYNLKGGTVLFECSSGIVANDVVEFAFNKDRGIESILVRCKECDESKREYLVGDSGLGRPCRSR